MRSQFPSLFETRRVILRIVGLALMLATTVSLFNCGGTTSIMVRSNPPVGTVSVSVSDPPSCKVPSGNYKRVYITIRSVQAHTSGTATDSAGGWQELAPQLANAPVQVDLLASPTGGCALAQLGSNVSVPAGDYQQIRLVLVSNNPAAGTPAPATNACGNAGFNCAVLSDDSVHQLELSSQSNTGLKIPPGQIVGGPLRVQVNQHIDINIDFNACASIVAQGNGQFRLRPALTAGQVSSVSTGLGGQVVNSATMQPISGGSVVVALEQPDSAGVDRVIMQAAADANGNFNFCPLPAGMYDIVVVGTDGSGTSYGATVLLNVSAGTQVGKIPLVAQAGAAPANSTATIQGTITSSSGTAPMTTGVSIDAALSALQTVSLAGGGMRQVTIPLQGMMSTPTVATAAAMTCPTGTNCAQYTLIGPASNPSVGTFSAGGTMFSAPAAAPFLYTIEARAFAPMSGGTPICTPSTKTTDKDMADMPLGVIGGATTTAKQLDFTGCS